MHVSSRQQALLGDSGSNIEWEETPCLLCGGESWTPLVEAPDVVAGGIGQWFMIVQCRDCGLCFTNPRPSAESIAQFYRGDYDPHQSPEDHEGRTRWWQRVPLVARLQYGRKCMTKVGEGRLLDFGCGSGSFLLRMRHQGWNVVGLDMADDVVQRLREEHGLTALAGTLPHPELPDDSFDVVTMWHSLEHVHEPMQALQSAHHLLAPGGKVIVAVPNIDCLPFRWFGQAWFGLDLPRHLVHFAPWTLRVMLHRAGFRKIRVRMQRSSSWLRKTACRAGQFHPQLSFWQRRLQGRTLSNLACWYSYCTRQTDRIVAEAVKL